MNFRMQSQFLQKKDGTLRPRQASGIFEAKFICSQRPMKLIFLILIALKIVFCVSFCFLLNSYTYQCCGTLWISRRNMLWRTECIQHLLGNPYGGLVSWHSVTATVTLSWKKDVLGLRKCNKHSMHGHMFFKAIFPFESKVLHTTIVDTDTGYKKNCSVLQLCKFKKV